MLPSDDRAEKMIPNNQNIAIIAIEIWTFPVVVPDMEVGGIENPSPSSPEGMLGVETQIGMDKGIEYNSKPQRYRNHPGGEFRGVQENSEQGDWNHCQLDEINDVHPQSGGGIEGLRGVVDSMKSPKPGNPVMGEVQPISGEIKQ